MTFATVGTILVIWWLAKEGFAIIRWLFRVISNDTEAFEIQADRCYICEDYQYTQPLGSPINVPVCHDCALLVPIKCWEEVSIYV